jgi:biotin operon repressor/predicted phosphodiesterase
MSTPAQGLPVEWWKDPALLQREVKTHGGFRPCSVAHSGAPSDKTLRKYWTKHGLPLIENGYLAKRRAEAVKPGKTTLPPVGLSDDHDDQWLLTLLKKRGDGDSIESLADAADVSPRRVREAMARLGKDGYRIAEEEQRVIIQRRPMRTENVHKALFKGETVRFGVISDTHLGSKHERLDELHHAYNVLRDEGITTVYHPGDLVCGYGIFPGQNNEVHKHTYEDQVAYAVENYPSVKGITTHLIGGNHDLEGSWGKAGANPCVAFVNQRDDFVYMGDYQATVELEQGTRINLLHPKGGIGYAADYKVRKLAEGFESGTKPNVMLIGHFHRRFDVEARGIHALLCGCFESGGSFGARLGLSDPAVGFHIVEMTVADDGSVVKWTPSWYRFWPGRTVEVLKAA